MMDVVSLYCKSNTKRKYMSAGTLIIKYCLSSTFLYNLFVNNEIAISDVLLQH